MALTKVKDQAHVTTVCPGVCGGPSQDPAPVFPFTNARSGNMRQAC